MGIYYGNDHYAVRFFIKGDILAFEHVITQTESIDDQVEIIRKNFLRYKNEITQIYLYVDITTTYDGLQTHRGWQPLKVDEMDAFLRGEYKGAKWVPHK